MRQALFALASLAAAALLFVAAFVVARLAGQLHGGWLWAVVGIVVLAAIIRLARRERN
jgi:hypothetical protein